MSPCYYSHSLTVVLIVVTESRAPLRLVCFFFLMIRRPPRSTLDRSSAASDVYKRQIEIFAAYQGGDDSRAAIYVFVLMSISVLVVAVALSLIHISEPTRPY